MEKHIRGAYTLGANIERLIDLHAAWSQKQFGTDSERGPQGPIEHLGDEVGEVLAALQTDNRAHQIEEFADCLLLWLDGLRRAGFTIDEAVLAAFDKMEVNKTRKWVQPSDNTKPVFHDKTGEGDESAT